MKIQPSQLNAAIRAIPLPDNMRERPVSRQGYPVPYFAGMVNGEWDFRVVHPETFVRCVKQKLCWVCGQQLGSKYAFVAGPMCVITRTSAEPPCHYSCAKYAAIACPFLASPRMKRNEADLPEGHQNPAGVAIMRNPGVAAVFISNKYRVFDDGQGRALINMGVRPVRVEWYAQRREATFGEVISSIASGIELLWEQCELERGERERRAAYRQLSEQVLEVVTHYMPPALPGEMHAALQSLSPPAPQVASTQPSSQ